MHTITKKLLLGSILIFSLHAMDDSLADALAKTYLGDIKTTLMCPENGCPEAKMLIDSLNQLLSESHEEKYETIKSLVRTKPARAQRILFIASAQGNTDDTTHLTSLLSVLPKEHPVFFQAAELAAYRGHLPIVRHFCEEQSVDPYTIQRKTRYYHVELLDSCHPETVYHATVTKGHQHILKRKAKI